MCAFMQDNGHVSTFFGVGGVEGVLVKLTKFAAQRKERW